MKKNNLILKILKYTILSILDVLLVKSFVFLVMNVTGDRLISMSLGIIFGLAFMQIIYSLTQIGGVKIFIRLIIGVFISLFSFLIAFTVGSYLKIGIDNYGFYDLIVKFIVVSIILWEAVDILLRLKKKIPR